MNLSKLCEFCKRVSVKASFEIMEVYGNDFSFELKVTASLATVADKKAESVIRKVLNRTGIPVIIENIDFSD